MTEFDYFPIKKVTIHEMTQYKPEEFVNLFVHPGGRLSWCDGILFDFQPFVATPDIIALQLQGKYHWAALQFCKYEKYPIKLTNREINYEMLIADSSSAVTFREMVSWLKKQDVWNDDQKTKTD